MTIIKYVNSKQEPLIISNGFKIGYFPQCFLLSLSLSFYFLLSRYYSISPYYDIISPFLKIISFLTALVCARLV